MTWPSLILHGRGVASHSAAGGFVEAIAVEGDTIVAVGSNGEIDAPCRPSTRVVDLAGRLIVCAFDVTLVHPSPAVSKACVATCLASVVAKNASPGSAPMRQRCQPTRGCSAVTGRWKPYPVGCPRRSTSMRCAAGRPSSPTRPTILRGQHVGAYKQTQTFRSWYRCFETRRTAVYRSPHLTS